MINDFLSILKNPIDGSNFEIDFENKRLVSLGLEASSFHFEKNFARILVNKNNEIDSTSLHLNNNSSFDYQQHYELDAIHYDYFNNNESPSTKHEDKRLHQTIFKQISESHKLILDVGCGKAWLAKLALKNNKKIISLDISSTNPQKAVALYPSENHFGLQADVYNLPIKDNSLDCIVASEIMEHVSDPKLFINILYSKLKPNGRLIITTPYNEVLEYCLCVNCNKPTPRHAHLHSFNEKKIAQILDEGMKFRFKVFSNKFLLKLKSHVLLKYVPYVVWNKIDGLFNLIFKNQIRLMIVIDKT